jgi:hypothetical protein
MASGVGELIDGEARSGLRRLAGTKLTADIVIPERVVGEVVHQAPGVPAELAVRLRAGNRVLVTYGLVSAGATLADQVDVANRVMRVTLDSPFVALALKFLARSPGVEISGRELAIGFGHIPAVADYAAAWEHIQTIGLTTDDGVLRAHVELEVRSHLGDSASR